jgi:molybdate transport system regulatory protein
MRIRSKVWLEKGGKLVFGSGKSELLKAIEETGSIKGAAEEMGISFRRAWSYVTAIERRLGLRLIERTKGGKSGGGSKLTSRGKELIRKYDKMEKEISRFADGTFKEIFGNGD